MIVEFDEEAIKFLEKLPFNIRQRIFNKIMSCSDEPFRYFHRLTGRTDYRLRVGDYRAIAEINSRIQVTFIGHRRNVYNHHL